MFKLFWILALLVTATSSSAQIGSAGSDLVFTPVTPCRIFDTRTSQGGTGSIVAGGIKQFAVRDVASFASQGGTSTNCNLNASVNTAAIAVYLTVVTPATAGWITAYPSNATLPLAATVNFKAGDVLGNTTIVGVSQTSSPSLAIYSSSLVDVVGDVVGYYSKPVATPLQCVETGSNQVAVAAGAVATRLPERGG